MSQQDAQSKAASKIAKLHLFIATPCFGGLVTQRYMQSIFALYQFASMKGFALSIELLGYDSLITRSRNTLVAKFLDTPTASHLMFIDADIGFSVEQVVRMLNLDEDVVAGMYPLKLIDWENGGIARARAGEAVETAPIRFLGTPCEGKELERRDGFVTGVYAGTGFMLIKREVIMRMTKAYAHTHYRSAHTQARPNPSPNQFALFDCIIEPESGTYLSEDYTFCRRWRDIGGKLWLDTQGVLIHVGTHDFAGNPQLRYAELGMDSIQLPPQQRAA
jgi:hypothetical protein